MQSRRELTYTIGEDDIVEFDYRILTDRFIDIQHFFTIWPGTNDNYYHFTPRGHSPDTIVRVGGLWRICTCDAATNNATHVVIPPEVYNAVVRKMVREDANMIAIDNDALVHLDDAGDTFSPRSAADSDTLSDTGETPPPAKMTKLESALGAPAFEIVVSHEDADGRFFKKMRADTHGRRVAVCFHCENAPPSCWREMYTHFHFDFVCVACAHNYDHT